MIAVRSAGARRGPAELEVDVWLRRPAAQAARRPVLDEDLGELAWSADVALLTHLSSSRLAEARDAGDGFAFRTGLLDNTRNGVICSRLDAATADDRIADLLASLGLGAGRPLQHHVARLHGRTVGLATVFTTESTLLLTQLAVAPAERRAGIGRSLVLHVAREGAEAGCSLALLAPTPATVPFYEALGFTLVRDLPDRAFYLPPADA